MVETVIVHCTVHYFDGTVHYGIDLEFMLGFRHKDSKAQSGTKGSKKKKATLSASFCFCVFVAIKHTPKGNFTTAYIANHYLHYFGGSNHSSS